MRLGEKYDEEKPRWDLIPYDALEDVVLVLTYGAKKYDDNNWQLVEKPYSRYGAAMMRHIAAWMCGKRLDRETGLPHLAHAVCCALFILWKDKNQEVPSDK